MDIQETPFTEALLDDIESHPCIAAASRDIDDVVERWYNSAANRFLPDDFNPYEDDDCSQPDEDDVLPF